MCERENARKTLHELLEQLKIERVVFVDDQYNCTPTAEDIIGLCTEKGLAACCEMPEIRKIFTSTTDEIWQSEVRRNWETLIDNEKKSIYNQLIQQTNNEDKKSVSLFWDFLNGLVKVSFLSLYEWKLQKVTILEETDMTNTLFLFDQDLSNNGGKVNEGYNLVSEVLAARPDGKILCGILSHVFTEGQEYEGWSKIKEEYNIDPHQCILISKQRLSSSDFMGFVHMMKLTILNSHCRNLKNVFSELVNRTNLRVKSEIDKINIFDFEYIVFNSSRIEGVSELDTLFRINELFYRKFAQKMAMEDTELHTLTSRIRNVSYSCNDEKIIPQLSTWKIQRQELYDDGEYLNSFNIPLVPGDIFEKTSSGRKFILLGQPCDLMVRCNGERNRHVVEGILAEIVKILPENSTGFELPYFNEDTSEHYYVNFRRTYNIKLWVLDLCVYQKDGKSKIVISDKCSELIIPAWNLYYKNLCENGGKIIKQYEELKKLTNEPSLLNLVLLNSYDTDNNIFKGTVNVIEKSISFDCKRILRLCQIKSTELLTEFSHYCARAANNSDFGKVS